MQTVRVPLPPHLAIAMKKWTKLSQQQIRDRVFHALDQNVNYYEEDILGVPASHLDSRVFYQNHPFLKDAPFISTLIHNPNHIGCHTLGKSESFFKGTQELEREVIEICGRDILKGEADQLDGYVASGGTEANLQAVWVYRNLFQKDHTAALKEIAVLCSEDAHYSMDKAANVLQVGLYKVAVDQNDRSIDSESLVAVLKQMKADGVKHVVVVANMMTTMFGSVDDVKVYTTALEAADLNYKVHIDGAYGGFFFPFAKEENNLNFSNPKVSSITLDAHKMAQAPYGTGIFLARKGLIDYANTKEASYVEGEDYTLIGSRSGANAIAIWMILMTHGPFGMREKVAILKQRSDWVCNQLKEAGIEYFRHPESNIVTIKSEFIPENIAHDFGLVPDNHTAPNWFKIVIMEHVSMERLEPLVEELVALRN